MRARRGVALGAALAALGGCTTISSNYTAEMAGARPDRIVVCHGFDCRSRERVELGAPEIARIEELMQPAIVSAEAERQAVGGVVAYVEELGVAVIGVRDGPKSDISQTGERGQMDCIDESTNTQSVLRYLAGRKLLRHHTVKPNVSRGVLVDGRYPHSTAVLETRGGERWAVDSWYEPSGGRPDIMPLEKWLGRGVLGER